MARVDTNQYGENVIDDGQGSLASLRGHARRDVALELLRAYLPAAETGQLRQRCQHPLDTAAGKATASPRPRSRAHAL